MNPAAIPATLGAIAILGFFGYVVLGPAIQKFSDWLDGR